MARSNRKPQGAETKLEPPISYEPAETVVTAATVSADYVRQKDALERILDYARGAARVRVYPYDKPATEVVETFERMALEGLGLGA